MKKYNIANYVRYKTEVEAAVKRVRKPIDGDYTYLTNEEIVINFLPLVETLARKQSTSDQASGVLSINDLLQEGAAGLTAAVSKLDRTVLAESDDQEKTIKSFLSKRIKGAVRRAVDINRGGVRIPEHKLNEIRRNPKDETLPERYPRDRAVKYKKLITIQIHKFLIDNDECYGLVFSIPQEFSYDTIGHK